MFKIKNFLSPKEIIVLTVSVIISGVLASSIWWYQAPNPDAGKYEYYGYNMLVHTATGGDVTPFHTTYEVIYDKTRPAREKAQVQGTSRISTNSLTASIFIISMTTIPI
ncbi:MAG: hypothetical protein NTV44_04800 [Firmicutes bacterium]|nr:hypothetical protein [Bacillota bacterium]